MDKGEKEGKGGAQAHAGPKVHQIWGMCRMARSLMLDNNVERNDLSHASF